MLGLLLIIAGVVLGIILQGLRKIPADPPHVAVVTRFGKRTNKIKDEGWRFFPLYPFWYGYILVDMTKKNKDFEAQEVVTPDLAQLVIPVSITFTPDKTRLREYLNSGGEVGVSNILEDVVQEKLRVWAMAVDEGPATAEEGLAAADNAIVALIKAITGEELSRISSAQVRQGNGTIAIPSLGIILNRFNLGKIKAIGKFAEAADLQVKERKEREAETLEIQHVSDTIQRLRDQLGITTEAALEVLQTERGKVAKSISESKWNISPETRAMIEKIAPEVLTGFLKKLAKGGD